MTRRFASALAAFLSVAAPNCLIAQYFKPLGDLPGGNQGTYAYGISDDGRHVVDLGHVDEFYWVPWGEAVRWTPDLSDDGGPLGLGRLSDGLYIQYSLAQDASADGSVVVGTSGNISNGQAFLWTSEAGMVGLGHLPGGFSSNANAVSADGNVVVGSAVSYEGISGTFAFRWTSSDGIVSLGDLPGSMDHYGEAIDTSADGAVVVGFASHQAFRWTAKEGMVGLGVLPGGDFSSAARGVSADGGVIVGASYSSPGLDGAKAFRWTAEYGMSGLGDLPGGLFNSYAADVSADGSIIFGWGTSDRGQEAILWDSQFGMRSIRSLLLDQGVDVNDWRLIEATGVAADRSTIVGYGVNPSGTVQAWIANITPVPEPASLVLFTLAILMLGAWRRIN